MNIKQTTDMGRIGSEYGIEMKSFRSASESDLKDLRLKHTSNIRNDDMENSTFFESVTMVNIIDSEMGKRRTAAELAIQRANEITTANCQSIIRNIKERTERSRVKTNQLQIAA